ncbi:MAG: beta-glucosidase [Oscillospiraceae bacterium]|jgi:beta-glucosidase|nr:beta-glucosidase [Oscillospiraceae bacterium]
MADYPYKNPDLPIEERVADLMGRMTLKEKIAQICSNVGFNLLDPNNSQPAYLKEHFPDGLGRYTQYSTTGLTSHEAIAALTNRLQRYFVEGTRLGIPVMLQTENLCGYPSEGGTMFPAMINAASTFDPELARQIGEISGEESMAVGIRQAMSPVLDVSRDPRWGRVYETFGEDPYLISQMGVGYVSGMQQDKKNGVHCIAKHFLGYAETQGGLNTAATRICDKELYEIFATPFEAAMKEAGLSAVMSSYSEIDGIPVGANPKILRKLLRDKMGFDGWVVSDGGAVWKMFDTYHIAKDYKEAGLLAIKGGIETEIPVSDAFRQLDSYVESGELDIKYIDDAVRHVLVQKFQSGLFENPYVDEAAVAGKLTNPEKQAVSMRITEESMVLLKNQDRILPLDGKKTAAVIGPHAHALRPWISGYTIAAFYEMLAMRSAGTAGQSGFNGLTDEERKAEVGASAKAEPKKAAPALRDIEEVLREDYGGVTLKEALGKRMRTVSALGCQVNDNDISGIPAAIEAAKQSDVVILTLGGNCGWGNTTGGEGRDRSSLELPGVQQQLLEAVAATGKDIVLVLGGPGPYAPRHIPKEVKAILNVWLPGVYGGEALARILTGETSPSGRLPATMPRSAGQIPIYYYHKTGSGYTPYPSGSGAAGFAANIFVGGYTDAPGTPLFPFGHGLSYTDFSVTDCTLDAESIPTDGAVTASCLVKNIGPRAGSEVIQLYYWDMEAHVTRPLKQLCGFKKVALAPGETVKVSFTVPASLLGFVNEEDEFVVEPGRMQLMIGRSSEQINARLPFTLTGKTINLAGRRAYRSTEDAVRQA